MRTYPVYVPDREPRGYWEMLQRVGPKPLIEPDGRWTEADWITAGGRVFDDHLALRTRDPKWIAAARSAATFDPARTMILPTGEVFGMRWVPTSPGGRPVVFKLFRLPRGAPGRRHHDRRRVGAGGPPARPDSATRRSPSGKSHRELGDPVPDGRGTLRHVVVIGRSASRGRRMIFTSA